jgi:hypothetical protein
MSKENQIEENLIEQLKGLKYIHRPDIVDRKTLEQNFKAKFEELNRVHLTDNEFLRLREEIINLMYSLLLNFCVKDNTFNVKTERLYITLW